MPIGIALLFLMAVAPVLPWRKASQRTAARPAVLAGVVRRRCARDRRRGSAPTGWAPLVAFGLAGFAAGAALRQLVLATRRQGWRGLVGRANGGMVVHLGVILVAVALVASNSYTRVGRARPARSASRSHGAGTRSSCVDIVRRAATPAPTSPVPTCSLDGDQVYGPAITTYLRMGTRSRRRACAPA